MKNILLVLLCAPTLLCAQLPSRWENHSYRHFDRSVYASPNFHTSVRPFLMNQVDSIVSLDTLYPLKTRGKLLSIFFNRSWLSYRTSQVWLSVDPYINFEGGRGDSGRSYINSRGAIISGGLGKTVAFTTMFQENQAVFNDYRASAISTTSIATRGVFAPGYGVMPGEGNVKPFKTSGYDWAVATGVVSYSPSHYFNFQLGNGKNSWGDGYRSLLLSDCATAYPFFKITTDFWRLKYVNLWAQLTDLRSPITSQQLQAHGYNKKWASLHYLSWNALSWVNLSFFEGVVWEHSSEQGYRGFDVQYANPIVFYRPVESQNGSPDNMLMGGSAKVTILKRHVLYGQVIIDEFSLSHMKARDGWWANKYGIQAGVKVFDLFTLKHLDLQAEYNRVRPFTYSHWTSLQSYGHYNQPLAHPLGANFQELVTISRYTIKRFFVDLKVVMARYGTDLPGQNVGHDIFEAYSVKRKELGNTLGQGLSNKLLQTDVCLSWLVNPVSNLNLAVGYTTRDYLVGDKRTVRSLLYFAVRTSLGNTSIDY